MHPQPQPFAVQLFLDFCAFFSPNGPSIFFVSTIHHVIWVSPGTLIQKLQTKNPAMWFPLVFRERVSKERKKESFGNIWKQVSVCFCSCSLFPQGSPPLPYYFLPCECARKMGIKIWCVSAFVSEGMRKSVWLRVRKCVCNEERERKTESLREKTRANARERRREGHARKHARTN